MEPTIPLDVQPMEKLQERYPDAVSITWIVSTEMKDRPGKHREHVFDCENGVRLIISKEMYNRVEMIHFSGSIWDDNVARTLVKKKTKKMLKLIMSTFKEISGHSNAIAFTGFSEKFIPHFVTKE